MPIFPKSWFSRKIEHPDFCVGANYFFYASVAQSVEQRFRKSQVTSSTLVAGFESQSDSKITVIDRLDCSDDFLFLENKTDLLYFVNF